VEATLRGWLEDPTARRLVQATVAVVVILVVVRLARRSAERIANPEMRYRIRKLASFVGWIIFVPVLLAILGARLSGFTVALGVTGAGIAFALQEVIASVAGWIAVLFGGFYDPGDRIQLGGIKGDVIDIGVLRTTLMECGEWVKGDLYTGRIVRVANSFVFKEPVFNYSGDFPFLWDEIRLPVKYGSDRALAKQLIEGIVVEVTAEAVEGAHATWARMVRKYRIEDARIEPMVHLTANDNWLEYTARYIVDYRRRRGVRDVLFNRILDAFDASNGRVAMASATFQLVDAPTINVRLERDTTGAAPS